LAFWDWTAVPAGEAAHAIVLEPFVQLGIGFADAFVEDSADGGHRDLFIILARGKEFYAGD
jgi:hypothetical protein